MRVLRAGLRRKGGAAAITRPKRGARLFPELSTAGLLPERRRAGGRSGAVMMAAAGPAGTEQTWEVRMGR